MSDPTRRKILASVTVFESEKTLTAITCAGDAYADHVSMLFDYGPLNAQANISKRTALAYLLAKVANRLNDQLS